MKTHQSSAIGPEVMAELRQAAERAAKGIRDPEVMRQACAHMDQIREQIQQEVGVQDIGVQIIREMRAGR